MDGKVKSTFELDAAPLSGRRRLIIDGHEVPNVASVTLTVPARGPNKLTVQQVALDGHTSGTAEVQFVRRLIGFPLPKTEPDTDEVKDAVRELAGPLLARAATAEIAGGGTVTLEDGRKAHYLYVVDSCEVSDGRQSHDEP